MSVSVETVMRYINNFFEVCEYHGEFAIEDHKLQLPDEMPTGTFIAVKGSLFNDGVHRLELTHRFNTDETFNGVVYVLHPPESFLAICSEIAEYDEKNPTGSFVSESFGGYSYSRGSGSAETGTASTWQQAYTVALRPYRRMYTEVY